MSKHRPLLHDIQIAKQHTLSPTNQSYILQLTIRTRITGTVRMEGQKSTRTRGQNATKIY